MGVKQYKGQKVASAYFYSSSLSSNNIFTHVWLAPSHFLLMCPSGTYLSPKVSHYTNLHHKIANSSSCFSTQLKYTLSHDKSRDLARGQGKESFKHEPYKQHTSLHKSIDKTIKTRFTSPRDAYHHHKTFYCWWLKRRRQNKIMVFNKWHLTSINNSKLKRH